MNENLPEFKEAWGNDTRKVGATEYWDDRAVLKEVDTKERLIRKILGKPAIPANNLSK